MTTEVAEPMIPRVGQYLGTIKLGGYSSGDALLSDVRSHGRIVDEPTAKMLAGINISPKEKILALYLATGKDLGMPEGTNYFLDRIYSLAYGHGLEVCPNEVAPLVSLYFNGLKPAIIASSVVSPHKFCIDGETLSYHRVDDSSKILFSSDCMAIFAQSRPGHC